MTHPAGRGAGLVMDREAPPEDAFEYREPILTPVTIGGTRRVGQRRHEGHAQRLSTVRDVGDD
jgi:hypothetical protein